jgi:putative tricarboxylic transport membrane protein
LTGAALVALAAAILWHVRGFPAMPGQQFGPALFPGLVAAGLCACGVALIASGLRQQAPLLVLPHWLGRPRPRAGVFAVIAGLLGYILLADRLGFHLVGSVLLVVWMRALGASWRVALPGAVVFTLIIHLAFYKALRVPLPWGILERWAF